MVANVVLICTFHESSREQIGGGGDPMISREAQDFKQSRILVRAISNAVLMISYDN